MPVGKGNIHAPNPLAQSATQKAYADAQVEQEPFDSLAFIMAYEGGELEDDEIVSGFQHLLDSGLVWSLQGSYGRMATHLLEAGLIYR